MKTLDEQFLDFARKQPEKKEYNYSDYATCACGEFAKSLGMFDQYTDYIRFRLAADTPFVHMELHAASLPHTWGALVKRLEEDFA